MEYFYDELIAKKNISKTNHSEYLKWKNEIKEKSKIIEKKFDKVEELLSIKREILKNDENINSGLPNFMFKDDEYTLNNLINEINQMTNKLLLEKEIFNEEENTILSSSSHSVSPPLQQSRGRATRSSSPPRRASPSLSPPRSSHRRSSPSRSPPLNRGPARRRRMFYKEEE